MTKITATFKESIQFWFCLVVYGWALEFQSIIPLDHEPLFDRVLDCAAILLTLAFWGLAACLTIVIVGTALRLPDVPALSRLVCKAGLIISSAFYLTLWLKNWTYLAAHQEIISLILACSCVGLTVPVVLRRRSQKPPASVKLPSFEECFRFGALPILLAAVCLVWFQVLKSSMHSRSASAGEVSANSPKDESSRPNVILILADGLRAKSMSLYGYQRKTTPYLEQLAAHSDVYTQMHSNITATSPSLTTLFSGKYPLHHGRLKRYQPPYQSDENLLNILKQNGYNTAAVITTWDASMSNLGLSSFLSIKEYKNFRLLGLHHLENFGIRHTKAGNRMREHFYDRILSWVGFSTVSQTYLSADGTLATVRTLLPTLKEPYFLYVHLMEPHEPYLRPPQYEGIYSSKESERLQKQPLTFYDYYRPEDQPIVDAYRDRYDETVQFLDHELGKFISFIDHRPQWKNLLLIVTSDHGESFEHGYLSHGDDLHEPSTHIPLVIHWPSQKQSEERRDFVQTVDIAPTILLAAGIPIPSWMDGQPLGPHRDLQPSDNIAINHTGPFAGDLPNQLAIWSRQHKLIVNCDTHEAQLFDLSSDPSEAIDISSEQPLILKDLTSRLETYLQKGVGKKLLPCLTRN